MDGKSQQGMTLIELVIVIVILSILVAVASIRLSNPAAITLTYQAELFAGHIRYLQSLALNWGCELNLNITSTTTYTVTSRQSYAGKACHTAAATINNPSTQQPFSVSLSDSVQFSATSSLGFDSLGRPIDTTTGVLLSSNTQFNMTAGGIIWRVTVSPVSGFVSLVKL